MSWCTSEEKSLVLPLTLDSRKFSPGHRFLLFGKEVRLWIKDLFCHLMDLNWVYLVLLGCGFTADSVMNPWNSTLFHPPADSPFTEHWLYTYCATDTVQRQEKEDHVKEFWMLTREIAGPFAVSKKIFKARTQVFWCCLPAGGVHTLLVRGL